MSLSTCAFYAQLLLRDCESPCSLWRAGPLHHDSMWPGQLYVFLSRKTVVIEAADVPCLRFHRAYVVPGNKDITSEQIAQWVDSKVANHKKLRGGVILVHAIPKSPSGKILRKVLRDQAKAEKMPAKL